MREFAVRVKRYYELGLWSEKRVRDGVEKGKLSEKEYAEITGQEYVGEAEVSEPEKAQ